MTLRQRHGYAMLLRIRKFAKDHAAILPAAAQLILPELNAAIGQIDQFASQKLAGRGQRRSSVAQRRAISRQLRYALADIARMARVLDRMKKTTYSKTLRLPRNLSYPALLTTGDAFIKILTPEEVKSVFIGAGLPATVIDDLAAILVSFRAAAESKAGGLLTHVQARRALADATANGILLARALDAMLTPQLRTSDRSLFAAWKSVLRLERGTKKSDTTAPIVKNETPVPMVESVAPAVVVKTHAPPPISQNPMPTPSPVAPEPPCTQPLPVPMSAQAELPLDDWFPDIPRAATSRAETAKPSGGTGVLRVLPRRTPSQ